MLKTSVNDLLEKEMDRKDFLKHVGIGIVALTGVTAALNSLVKQPAALRNQSYGANTYGGIKK